MRVLVKLTEPIWRAVGTRELQVEFPGETAAVGAVLDELVKEFPRFGEEIYSGSGLGNYHYGLFLNDQPVNLAGRNDITAKDGDEIFILVPISGGQLVY